VHILDLATKKERFFTDGSGLEIGGGAYDWFWLVKPDGKEVGPVGETTDNFHSTFVK
jgi:hypothetical protein